VTRLLGEAPNRLTSKKGANNDPVSSN